MSESHPIANSPRNRTARRVVLSVAPYVLVPLLAVFLFEAKFRRHIWSQTFGYQTVLQTTGGNHFDMLFIGTSRTIAAVDESLFSRLVSEQSGKAPFTVNMAGGGNKLISHYMGLRRIYEEDPDRTAGMDVFIEAPDGLPDYMPWTDDWVFQDYKHQFLPNMRREDLVPFLLSETPINTRLHITINFLLYDWRTFERRYVIRNETIRIAVDWLERRITALTGREKPVEEGIDNIVMRGGIVADPRIVANNEMFFNRFYQTNKRMFERPWRNWDDTVLAGIVGMVERNGGRVVLFNVPQYSIFNRIYRDLPMREGDRMALREYIDRRNIPLLMPPFQFTDDDFPDRFHLGIPESERFTRALAEEYLNLGNQ